MSDVVGRAAAGEQVEAYASRVRETDVRVFDGAVESLTVAEHAGVGVRVVVGGRQGFAWAGTLDPDVVGAALDEARDNAGFATPDEWQGVATPDEANAAAAPVLDLWSDDLALVPTDDKVTLALELERATRAADPRVRGVETAEYGDALAESAVANSLGVTASNRRTTCSCMSYALAGEGTATQTGYGFSAGRSFADLDPGAAAPRRGGARHSVARCDAAEVAALAGGVRPARDPLAARVVGQRARGRSDPERPVDVRRARGRDRGGAEHHARRRPDGAGWRSARRRTTPRACRRVVRDSWSTACCAASSTTRTRAVDRARARRARPCAVGSRRRPVRVPARSRSRPGAHARCGAGGGR